MFRTSAIFLLIFCISFLKVKSQSRNDIYCFKIDSYKFFSKKNNKLSLSYSSILKGNITIGLKNGKFILLKSGESGLMIDDLPNGKIMFYNVYNAPNYKTIINSSELEKDDFEIILEDETTLTQYNFVRIRNEVGIYSSISSGTSFFIDSNHLLTNYHVVVGNGELKVYIREKSYNCKIEKYDSILDLAVLKVLNYSSSFWAKFNTNKIEIGESCYALGFPLASLLGDDLKFTSGIVSAINGFKDNPNYLQITSPIDPGNSGGPLIDQNGNVIGVISAKFALGTNIGYALKTGVIKKIWNIFVSNNQPTIMTPPEVYKRNSKITFLIKNYIL